MRPLTSIRKRNFLDYLANVPAIVEINSLSLSNLSFTYDPHIHIYDRDTIRKRSIIRYREIIQASRIVRCERGTLNIRIATNLGPPTGIATSDSQLRGVSRDTHRIRKIEASRIIRI